jgi:hypothetical protein
MFNGNPVATLEPQAGPYAGKKVAIISERNLVYIVPTKIEFELCDA